MLSSATVSKLLYTLRSPDNEMKHVYISSVGITLDETKFDSDHVRMRRGRCLLLSLEAVHWPTLPLGSLGHTIPRHHKRMLKNGTLGHHLSTAGKACAVSKRCMMSYLNWINLEVALSVAVTNQRAKSNTSSVANGHEVRLCHHWPPTYWVQAHILSDLGTKAPEVPHQPL